MTLSLASLTDAQREAVEHFEGPLLILAGPGSGKTRVVTHRIARLLERGVPARQMVALTFTNKAAEEMRNRIALSAPGEPVWMSTFHRFCARLLRQYAPHVGLAENYCIYDTDDSGRVLKRVLEERQQEAEHFTPARIAAAIGWAKNSLIQPEQYQAKPGSPIGKIVAEVYPAYQARLAASNAVDFDDLLLHVATLLRENPEIRRTLDERFRFVLVDEYQDTNLAQYTLVRALSIDHPNLAVTGDPDQSIYGWRGANLSNILDFEKDYPDVHVVRLEQNYRSTQRILRVADTLISYNIKRKPKDLFTENDEGRPVRLAGYPTQDDEAGAIAARIATEVRAGRRRPRDFAIFYRMNALTRALEHALHEQGVPYQMINAVEFYQRKEIKDVLGYLALLNNPVDDIAFLRVINSPARKIGKTTLNRMTQHANSKGLCLLDAARESGLIEGIATRTAIEIAKFVALFDRLSVLAAKPVEEIVGHVLAETGYKQQYENSELQEDQDRLANIEELLTAASQFDEHNPGEGHLEEFLEGVALVNDTDGFEVDHDRVTLMTLHASKGLEFPAVFIIGLEEGIIPHERSQQQPAQLEEERRLLFVGITRAREELHLSRAICREFRGRRGLTVPSSFLMELPREEMDVDEQTWSVTTRNEPEPAAEDWSQVDDDSFDFGANAGLSGSSRAVTGLRNGRLSPLQTAAELAQSNGQSTALATADDDPQDRPAARPATRPLSPEVFHQGMAVIHPLHGLGKIVALSGTGDQRKATVAFASEAGQLTFVLQYAPLRPARLS